MIASVVFIPHLLLVKSQSLGRELCSKAKAVAERLLAEHGYVLLYAIEVFLNAQAPLARDRSSPYNWKVQAPREKAELSCWSCFHLHN